MCLKGLRPAHKVLPNSRLTKGKRQKSEQPNSRLTWGSPIPRHPTAEQPFELNARFLKRWRHEPPPRQEQLWQFFLFAARFAHTVFAMSE